MTKDFEIVETPRCVVALDHEEDEWPESDEDWENVYATETQHVERQTYSEVLTLEPSMSEHKVSLQHCFIQSLTETDDTALCQETTNLRVLRYTRVKR